MQYLQRMRKQRTASRAAVQSNKQGSLRSRKRMDPCANRAGNSPGTQTRGRRSSLQVTNELMAEDAVYLLTAGGIGGRIGGEKQRRAGGRATRRPALNLRAKTPEYSEGPRISCKILGRNEEDRQHFRPNASRAKTRLHGLIVSSVNILQKT